MKQIVMLVVAIFVSLNVFSQCTIVPWSLDKRVEKSSLVVEGKVISSKSTWDRNHKFIYTLNQIEVYRSFKGSASQVITVVTEGGTVGLDKLHVSPSLELENQQVGIFLLRNGDFNIGHTGNLYKPIASVQSFIQYDLLDVKAFDFEYNYYSISGDLYETIKSITKEPIQEIKAFYPEAIYKRIRALANPIVDSLSTDTLSSGTGTLLTIYGSNFGVARGSGKVGFRDANSGSGSYYYPPVSTQYQSWSNSQIKVFVPSRAGTGTIRVTNNLGESGNSSEDLFVEWAHSNIFFPLGSDTFAFEIDHVNDNNAGGYTWQMTNNFASKSDAVQSFTRSLEEWRCETQMNWIIGTNTTTDSVGSDDVNVVRFTNFGDSKLGVCYSWYTGCYYNFGNDLNWIVKELDIEFDSTYSWYYGTGSPAGNQYDFQSVATHELGHGHQLAHVRDASKLMHYSLSSGQRKSDLVTSDIDAGVYIMNKGKASSPCGPTPIIAVPNSTCTLTPPDAKFSIEDTVICPGDNIVISDSTEGSVSTYSWNFGLDATPASSSNIGPHTVSYSTSGTKTIQMIVTNVIGSDTLEKTVFVKANQLDTPNFVFLEDSVCLGAQVYNVNLVDNAELYTWSLSGGGSIAGANGETSVTVNWTSGGVHSLTVSVENECISGIEKSDSIFVVQNTVAQFSDVVLGLEIEFTSEATDAETQLWTFGDGSSSTDTNPTHQYPDKGDYTVKFKTFNLCSEDSVTKSYSLAFIAGSNNISNKLILYPNPVKRGTKMFVNGFEFSPYEIISMDGKLIQDGKVMNNSIDISVVEPSIYVVKLKKSNLVYYYKIQIVD
ncbi:MAG: PKD domain-containing protein [Bacteroidia bacterium]|nr:PKD domain-containing protein [Bacteroidia bacterium]